MFTLSQRDRIRDAIEARAAKVSKVNARKLRRVAGDSRVFDRFVDRQYKRIKRTNPLKSDGEILKILIEFITSGALAQLIAAIAEIFSK